MTDSTVLDALVYLAEAGLDDDSLARALDPALARQEEILTVLGSAGFSARVAEEAWAWLHGLVAGAEGWRAEATGLARRVYTPREERILDADCRAFLEELEALGVLDAPRRELVVDRALALDQPGLALEDLRWVVFYVLQGGADPVLSASAALGGGVPFVTESDYLH